MLHAPLLARRQELLDLERSLDAQIACKEQERQQLLVAIREERELQTQAQALREAELEGVQLQLNKLALNVVLVNESNVVYGDWVSGKEYEYRAVLLKAGKVQVEHYERDLLLQVATAPFAQGGLRQAFWARDQSGTRVVLKRPIQESAGRVDKLAEAHEAAKVSAYSAFIVESFCSRLGAAVEIMCERASLVVLNDPTAAGGQAIYAKENLIEVPPGQKWIKWIRNDGVVMPEGEGEEVIHALAHFSRKFGREAMGKSVMLLDAQGIKRGEGRYTLSDPALCSSTAEFGSTDLGSKAIFDYMQGHTCGPTCAVAGCAGA